VDWPLVVVEHQIGDRVRESAGERARRRERKRGPICAERSSGDLRTTVGPVRSRARGPASSGHASCREEVWLRDDVWVPLRERCECSAGGVPDARARSDA
jgi:hypothetical protein